MSITIADGVRQRLLAYILPCVPKTAEQNTAMDNAVEAQVAYETASGLYGLPGNVKSISNDGVSMNFESVATDPTYTRDTISPVAWSYLRNAGLIVYSLPTARKP